MKIGITERGDAALDYSWTRKMDTVNGAIIISKNPTSPKLRKALIKFKNKVIFHSTITLMGNSEFEPNVPDPLLAFKGLEDLINEGFPVNQIVLRVDPIAYDFQIRILKEIMPEIKSLGISRIRFSLMDCYTHVKKRFNEIKIDLPWLDPDLFQIRFLTRNAYIYDLNKIGEYFGISIESCAEEVSNKEYPNIENIGCISEKDLNILGITGEDSKERIFRRNNCLCLNCKTELLKEDKRRCAYKCLYCYWKD